jgi:hypothetical protein
MMVTLLASVSLFSLVCRVPADFSTMYWISLTLILNDAQAMSVIHQYADID